MYFWWVPYALQYVYLFFLVLMPWLSSRRYHGGWRLVLRTLRVLRSTVSIRFPNLITIFILFRGEHSCSKSQGANAACTNSVATCSFCPTAYRLLVFPHPRFICWWPSLVARDTGLPHAKYTVSRVEPDRVKASIQRYALLRFHSGHFRHLSWCLEGWTSL